MSVIMSSKNNAQVKALALEFVQIKLKAKEEQRDLTPEEQTQISTILTESSLTEGELKQIAEALIIT